MNLKNLFRVLRILFLCLVVYYVFGRNLDTIINVLQTLPSGFIIGLLAMGMLYYLLEGVTYFLAFRKRNRIGLKQGFTLSMLGMFANVTTAGVGAVPLQTFYLYKQKIDAGNAAGTFLYTYVLHKLSAILLAAVFTVISLFRGNPDLSPFYPYILYGFAVGLLICVMMFAAALSSRLNQFAKKLFGKMPDRFEKQREALLQNLDLLQEEVGQALKDPQTGALVMLADLLKFLSLCALPAVICRRLAFPVPVFEAMAFMSLIFAISGSLPNVSGMGPIEFAFLLFYGPLIGNDDVAALLLVYRLANYFFPFLISLVIVLFVRKKEN